MVVHELEVRVYCVEDIGEMHYALSLVEEHGFFYGQIRNLTDDRPVELKDEGQRSSQPRYRMVTGSKRTAYEWWKSARLPQKKSPRRAV